MPDTNFKNFIDALTEKSNIESDDFIYVRAAAGNRKVRAGAIGKVATNDISNPGEQGFGVGVYPSTLPAYMTALDGTFAKGNDQYGNYQVTTDGSIMCYIPRFYFNIS